MARVRWYSQETTWLEKVLTALSHAALAYVAGVAFGLVGYAPAQVLHLWVGIGAGLGAGFYLGRETTEAQRDLGPTVLAVSADRLLDLVGGYAGALAALHTHLHLLPRGLPFL